MSEVINSHVQLSKFLMKPFSHKTQDGRKVFYLDFKDCSIHEEKIKILGTKPKYYYPSTEDFLAKEVESKVGEIFTLFKETAKNKNSFQITLENDDRIKTVFSYAFLRSDGVKKETINKGVYLQFLPEKDQTELIINHPTPALKIFKDTFSNILINDSSVDFVLPHNCFYSVSSINKTNQDKFQFWCMPISPRCCALLIPNIHKNKFINNDSFIGLSISDDNRIRDFNNCALSSENTYSKNFVIGDINELNRLKTVLTEKHHV